MPRLPLKLYQQIHKHMPIPCVDVIVIHNSHFLLLKRKNRPAQEDWWFLGGRIYRDETLSSAVIRKTKEEAGINTQNPKLLGLDETMFPDGPFDWSTHTINAVFLVQVNKNQPIKLDGQSSEYRWFNTIDTDWHPYIQKFLIQAGFKAN